MLLAGALVLAAAACDQGSAAPIGPAASSTVSPAAVARFPPVPPPADLAAPPPDAQRTASGLAFEILTPGSGHVHPGPDDAVQVNVVGWNSRGATIDNTQSRVSSLNGLIAGYAEGIQLMVVGEKRRLWVPAALAYGNRPIFGPLQGDLVFDVELLKIVGA